MMSWAMRSPSCSQQDELAREVGALGVVDEQVAQQQSGALDVAPGLLEEREDARVGSAREQRPSRPSLARACARRPAASRVFHSAFTGRVTSARAGARDAHGPWKRRSVPWRGPLVGELEIRPGDGLVLAAGRRADLSVREFGLLVALARSARRIVSREELYARGVGRRAARRRPLDRRLRPQAARQARGGAARLALHPHPRRASATASRRSLHTLFTSRPQPVTGCGRGAVRACRRHIDNETKEIL